MSNKGYLDYLVGTTIKVVKASAKDDRVLVTEERGRYRMHAPIEVNPIGVGHFISHDGQPPLIDTKQSVRMYNLEVQGVRYTEQNQPILSGNLNLHKPKFHLDGVELLVDQPFSPKERQWATLVCLDDIFQSYPI